MVKKKKQKKRSPTQEVDGGDNRYLKYSLMT